MSNYILELDDGVRNVGIDFAFAEKIQVQRFFEIRQSLAGIGFAGKVLFAQFGKSLQLGSALLAAFFVDGFARPLMSLWRENHDPALFDFAILDFQIAKRGQARVAHQFRCEYINHVTSQL